jgi:arylsulfatase A-like enzyme
MAEKNSEPVKQPNIIVFVADDSGLDYGCYGNPYIQTPNIDKLAKSGIKFNNAFNTCPQSSPSRISMMTGMFAHTLGVEDLEEEIDENTPMIPSFLKQAGYYTGAILKTHWGENGTKQFDFYYSGRKELYSESYMTKANKFYVNYQRFLKQANDKPFFLWVGFIDPHRPYKEPITDKIHSPEKTVLDPVMVDAPRTRQDIADYYDEIHRLDQHIGAMLKVLEEQEKLENTVVLFLSDNGLPFMRGKGFLYDQGIHSPFIVSWPGKIKPESIHSNGLVSFIDIAPTILDIANIEKPQNFYGESIKPILLNPSLKGRTEIYAERNWHVDEEYQRTIRTEKYKLIYNGYPNMPASGLDPSKSPYWYDLIGAKRANKLSYAQSLFFEFPRPSVELYDLEKDPQEQHNLAFEEEFLPIEKKLMLKLREWQKQTKDTDVKAKEKPDGFDRITGAPLFPMSDKSSKQSEF